MCREVVCNIQFLVSISTKSFIAFQRQLIRKVTSFALELRVTIIIVEGQFCLTTTNYRVPFYCLLYDS